MGVRLFVGNLPYDATEEELKVYFSAVGPVTSVSMPVDHETGRKRGFAFVEFGEAAHAEEAVRRFNNQSFKGRPMAVNEARAREARAPGSGPRPSYSSPSSGYSRPRPFIPGGDAPPMLERAPRGDRVNRRFGPDAKPGKKQGPMGRRQLAEGKKRGPIKERSGGRHFGLEDEPFETSDDLELSAPLFPAELPGEEEQE